MKFLSEISRLMPYGQPADFFSTSSSQGRLVRISLLAAFFLSSLPFLAWQHPIFVPTWQSEWYAAMSGLLFSVVLLRSAAWREPIIPLSLVPIALLASIAIWQGFMDFSASLGVSWLYGLEMLWAALLMLSAMHLPAARLKRAMSYGLLVAGVVGGALGLVQSMRLPAFYGQPALFAQDGLAYGFLAQRNLFADLQSLAIMSLAFAPHSRHTLGRALRWFLLGLLAASAAASGSNALVLYIVFGLIWGLILMRRMPEQGRSLLTTVLVAAAIGGATFALRAHAQQVSHVAGASILLTLWKTSLQTIWNHPLWGIGIGNTPQVFYDFAASLPHTTQWAAFHAQGWNNVHNLVLQLWMEAGLLGLLVSLFLAGLIFYAMWTTTTVEQAWAIALLGVLGLHSMVEFPLWTMPFMALAAILISIISPRKKFRFPNAFGVAPIALSGLVVGLAALSIQMTFQFNKLTQIGEYNLNPKNVMANAHVLMSLDDQIKCHGLSAIILQPIATLAQARFPVMSIPQSGWEDAGRRMKILMRLMPFGYIPYINAQLLALNNHSEEAIEATRKALRATPKAAKNVLDVMEPFLARTPNLRPVAEQIEHSIKNEE